MAFWVAGSFKREPKGHMYLCGIYLGPRGALANHDLGAYATTIQLEIQLVLMYINFKHDRGSCLCFGRTKCQQMEEFYKLGFLWSEL